MGLTKKQIEKAKEVLKSSGKKLVYVNDRGEIFTNPSHAAMSVDKANEKQWVQEVDANGVTEAAAAAGVQDANTNGE